MPENRPNRTRILFDAAWNSLRKAGFLRSFQRAVQRTIPHWVFDINSLVAVDYDLEEWREVLPDEKWQHRWAGEQDDDQLKIGGLSDQDIQTFRVYNARAHLITKDGETVAYSWVIPDFWDILGWARVRLAPGEFYAAAAYVARAHRGQRLQGELRKFAWSQLAGEGHKRVVTFIEMLNRSSLRGQVKPARRYVGRFSYVRLLGLVVYRIDGKWGAGTWNRARPLDLSFDMFDRSAPSRPPKGAAT